MNRAVAHGLSRALCALATALPCAAALAQEWPAAPITVVSPVQAGSAGDTSLRLVLAKLSENLKQPVVVENLPGAAGMIGYDRLARAKPDGYTIGGISDSTLTYVPLVQGRKGFNALDALDPVTLLSTSTWVLVAHPSLPVRTVKELVAFSKANPGRLDYASAGIGGSHHVVMEAFKSASGSNLVHVPYRGAAAALADVDAGQVPVMFSALSVALGRIQAKRLVALAVATPARTSLLPEVPTLQEAGLPGFTFSTWTGVLVPKGTPPAIVERLNAELARALKDPGVAGKLSALGATPQPGTPRALAELIESTTNRMRKVIVEAKIRAE
ncbi:MAG: tripartite tricarboxylate transporter substrate binding protein [Rhodocyclaceae bacterium]|nr:tripartite tricarboxylate transporter substrate binding protein [Rhodocyclaceae bacterium]MCA3074718.1 tripartite tricarboxylate transporter substrate binding protein [Rhodocyclaceae bacterium]MCA3091656.1 tripartite tricarboxylate transporter substrate binding protein [Rhodocyclaceae bacterium]MCA3094008.1 tripartite tricarboxylate transporter substrate binding protein [Rhodocyclaceae bacterium]MCA3099201.1 tripartite tricarboxylate transporter substrate binding protein [Rhodocyclaceae bact